MNADKPYFFLLHPKANHKNLTRPPVRQQTFKRYKCMQENMERYRIHAFKGSFVSRENDVFIYLCTYVSL